MNIVLRNGSNRISNSFYDTLQIPVTDEEQQRKENKNWKQQDNLDDPRQRGIIYVGADYLEKMAAKRIEEEKQAAQKEKEKEVKLRKKNLEKIAKEENRKRRNEEIAEKKARKELQEQKAAADVALAERQKISRKKAEQLTVAAIQQGLSVEQHLKCHNCQVWWQHFESQETMWKGCSHCILWWCEECFSTNLPKHESICKQVDPKSGEKNKRQKVT